MEKVLFDESAKKGIKSANKYFGKLVIVVIQ